MSEPMTVGQTIVVKAKPQEIKSKTLALTGAPRSILRQMSVEYCPIIPRLEDFVNDPVRRRFINWNGGPSVAAEGEFAASQYCSAPLHFATNSCFWNGEHRFVVGDIVRLRDNSYIRLERLEFRADRVSFDDPDTDEGFPRLQLWATRFTAASVLQNVPGPVSLAEMVHWPGRLVDVDPSLCVRVCSLSGDARANVDVLCRYQAQALAGQPAAAAALSPYEALRTPRTFAPIEAKQPFFWISVFVDSFSGRRSRAHATTGIYASVVSMPLAEQQKRCNILPVMLLPPGVELGQVRSVLRALMLSFAL
jgi:hypothetical protein